MGIRGTWNGDPKSQHSSFSELKNTDFFGASHDVTQPLNSIIDPHNALLAYSTPLIDWQPRASFAWSVRPNTVIRAGGGIFSDIFPASVADGLLANAPNDNIFTGGSPYTGQPDQGAPTRSLVPVTESRVRPRTTRWGTSASAQQVALTGFANGLQSCYVTGLAPPNCLSPAAFTALPKGEFKYPYFAEWSFGIEQQFGNNWAAKVQYVGTRAIDLPYAVQANGFQTACAGCFNPYIYDPTFNGPDGRFAGVTQHQYGANSIYHALQASLQKRTSHGLTLNLNYTYSHCIDTLSNEGSLTGGFDPATSVTSVSPGELGLNRGNCDYDIRNVLNGSYIYQLPSLVHGNRVLGGIVNGWHVSGDLFLHSGFPFSVLSNGYGAGGQGVFQGSDPNYAIPTGANAYAKFAHSDTQSPGVPEIQWLNPSAFVSVVDPSTGSCTAGETIVGGAVTAVNDNASTCQYAKGGRNNVFGPPFKWTDLFVSKNFKINERVNFFASTRSSTTCSITPTMGSPGQPPASRQIPAPWLTPSPSPAPRTHQRVCSVPVLAGIARCASSHFRASSLSSVSNPAEEAIWPLVPQPSRGGSSGPPFFFAHFSVASESLPREQVKGRRYASFNPYHSRRSGPFFSRNSSASSSTAYLQTHCF